MDFIIEQTLNMGLPAIFAAMVLLLAFAPWKGNEYSCYWAGTIAMGLGYTIGHWRIVKLPSWEQDNWQWEWLFFLAMVATLVGLLDAFTKLKLWLRMALITALAIATCYLIVPTWVGNQLLLQIILGIAIVFLWFSVDKVAHHKTGASIPLGLIISATGASGFLALSGQAKFAQLIAVFAVLSSIALVIAWWNPTLSLTKGAGFPIAVVFPGILFSGYFNMDAEDISILSNVCYALIMAAPFCIWGFLVLSKSVTKLQQKKNLQVVLGSFLVLLPVVVALLISWSQQSGADSYPY